MNVFTLRNQLVSDYSDYISSFIQIRDRRIRDFVDQQLASGLLWPEALIQLNPAFQPGHYIDELVDEGVLHKVCKDIFRRKNEDNLHGDTLRWLGSHFANGELPVNLHLKFSIPFEEDELYLPCPHPLIESLANHLLETALDPLSAMPNVTLRRGAVERSELPP